jgi:hypothetical protein
MVLENVGFVKTRGDAEVDCTWVSVIDGEFGGIGETVGTESLDDIRSVGFAGPFGLNPRQDAHTIVDEDDGAIAR